MKLFWIALMIVGFGLAGWQLVAIFTEYFHFSVLTEVETHRGNVTFPHITICNKNGYRLSKAGTLMNYGFLTFLNNIRNLTEEERIIMSYNETEFLFIERGFQSKLFSTFETGNCYTLTPDQNLTVPRQVTSVLYVNRQEFSVYANIHANESTNPYVEDGVICYVREPGIYPISYKDTYVDVKPGENAEISITLETINRLGGKYGNCQDEVERFQLESGVGYSQDVCERLCPGCACKPRCRMQKYSLSVKTSDLPELPLFSLRLCKTWPDLCKDYITPKKRFIKSNIVTLTFRLDNTEHKVYTKIPTYPLPRFLSDIGGTLGLFVGISLLTMFELLQLLIVSVVFLIKFIRRGRKKRIELNP